MKQLFKGQEAVPNLQMNPGMAGNNLPSQNIMTTDMSETAFIDLSSTNAVQDPYSDQYRKDMPVML